MCRPTCMAVTVGSAQAKTCMRYIPYQAKSTPDFHRFVGKQICVFAVVPERYGACSKHYQTKAVSL